LSQQAFWDEATRNVVLERVNNPPPIRFFNEEETRIMQAVVDRIIPQDDRTEDRHIPVLPVLDKRLYLDEINGYRYEGMPPERDMYRLGIRAIEEIARHMYGRAFVDLLPNEQENVLENIHNGNPPVAHEIWEQMNVRHFWLLLEQDCIEAYYAHPWAWDEIGFGGPAYPRGYMRLSYGEPEPWEVHEKRYEWAPPPGAPSARFTPVGSGEEDFSIQTLGQAGSH
jgi:hypothetical protein